MIGFIFSWAELKTPALSPPTVETSRIELRTHTWAQGECCWAD